MFPLIAVMKQPEANLSDMDAQLKQRVNELNNHLLPQGVKMVPYYNQADFVDTAIKSIRDVLWVGILLAIIVTILFLRSFKSSIVILITVPVSLLLTIITMKAFGFNLNIMTLGAIAAAIGLVIDDAVVVVEQIHRTHEEHPEEKLSDGGSKSHQIPVARHGGLVAEYYCHLFTFWLDDGRCRCLFQHYDANHDYYADGVFPCHLVTVTCALLNFLREHPRKTFENGRSAKAKLGAVFLKRPYVAIALVAAMITGIS